LKRTSGRCGRSALSIPRRAGAAPLKPFVRWSRFRWSINSAPARARPVKPTGWRQHTSRAPAAIPRTRGPPLTPRRVAADDAGGGIRARAGAELRRAPRTWCWRRRGSYGAAPARARNYRPSRTLTHHDKWLQRGAPARARNWERAYGRSAPDVRFNGAAPARRGFGPAVEWGVQASGAFNGPPAPGAEFVPVALDGAPTFCGFNGAAPARARIDDFLFRITFPPCFNGAAPARAAEL